MLGSIIGLGLLVIAAIYKEPQWAIAAGLFELSGVLYAVTRPRRLKTKEVTTDGRSNEDRSR